MKHFLTLLFAAMCFSASAQSVAEKMAEAASKNADIAVLFEQKKHVSLLDDVVEAKILFATDGKGRMRWEVLEPYQSVMVYDGEDVCQFEFVADKWQKLNFAGADKFKKMFSEIRNMVLGRYDASAYDMSERDGKICIRPKSSDMRRIIAEIVITPRADFNGPQLIEITSGDGDKTELKVLEAFVSPANFDDAFDASNPSKFKLQ